MTVESHRQDDYGCTVLLENSLMIVSFASLNAAVESCKNPRLRICNPRVRESAMQMLKLNYSMNDKDKGVDC